MTDYLSLIRQKDEELRRQREKAKAERDARRADIQAFNQAWLAVVAVCEEGDRNPDSVPDLSPFVVLAKALRAKGWDVWLPELIDKFSEMLDDRFEYRAGHVFFLQLLISAGKPRATSKELGRIYQSFIPTSAPAFWRSESSHYIAECINNRIDLAEQGKASLRRKQLRKAAKRRPALEKQLFAVHCSDNGLRPAEIRDKWNAAHPTERLEPGRPGRHDIRIAVERGRAFLAEHNTTVNELAAALGITLS
jgi:hypothetical protein